MPKLITLPNGVCNLMGLSANDRYVIKFILELIKKQMSEDDKTTTRSIVYKCFIDLDMIDRESVERILNAF